MFKSRNSRGFTLAELAALLGVTALLASVLSPVVANAGEVSSNSSTITVSEVGTVVAEPETLPVEAILVNVTDPATGASVLPGGKPVLVDDPNATSTTITGLDPQKNYNVEVVKRSQAGNSPAATAKVNYTKVGEKTVETRTPRLVAPSQSTSTVGGVSVWKTGEEIRRIPQPPKMVFQGYQKKVVGYQKKVSGYQKKVSGYQKKSITVPAHSVTTHAYGTRQVTRTRDVRVAPFERAVTRSRSVYVAPYSYTYSCTKSRSYQYACGTNPTYTCGTETYPSTCGGGTKYCGGGTKYCKYPGGSYACGTHPTYACGTNPTYSCTKSRPKTCGGGTKYCTGTESYSSTCTGQGGGYWSSENYTDYEAVYNYRTETYTDTEQYNIQYPGAVTEGSCTFTSNWIMTGVGTTCANTTMTKQVDDTTKPIMVDDTTKPIMVDDTTKPIMGDDTSKPIYTPQPVPDVVEALPVESAAATSPGACPAGWTSTPGASVPQTVTVSDGLNGTRQVTVYKPVNNCFKPEQWTEDIGSKQVDVKQAVTTSKEVKAPARQLVIEVTGTPRRSMNWATGTVVGVGAGSAGYAKGDTVIFRYGTVFTFDGKQYLRVPASQWLVKKN
jgi:hypothetical protein